MRAAKEGHFEENKQKRLQGRQAGDDEGNAEEQQGRRSVMYLPRSRSQHAGVDTLDPANLRLLN